MKDGATAERRAQLRQGKPQGFIRHLHCFRGFAVLNIVAVHAWAGQVIIAGDAGSATGYRILNAVNETLFHDSTLYFALLSGVLFSLILTTRGWRIFFQRKVLNVLSPYIVTTALFTWYGLRDDDRLHVFKGSVTDYLAAVAGNLPFGDAMFHLWYMPVFLALCLLTPLLWALLETPRWRWLLWIIVLAPLVASRTAPAASSTTFVYFLGAYTVGLVLGRHYESAVAALQRNRTMIVAAALLTTAVLLHAFLSGWDKAGPVSLRESLFYFQKLAFAALALLWLRAREDTLPRWLDTVSTAAFAIYFLHAILLLIMQELQMGVAQDPVSASLASLMGLLFLILAVVVSLAVSTFARQLLGSRARMVLGA